MTPTKLISVFTVFVIMLACSQQTNIRTILGRSYAEQELKAALSDNMQHNVIDYNTGAIKDSVTAINVAEQVLFNIYGRDNIILQRPYETYFIDNYWVVGGTLPTGSEGGTFSIITDARDGRILKVTHGK